MLSLVLTKFPIMRYIPFGSDAADQHEHEWFDDQITQKTSTLTADIAAHGALATGITVTVADGTVFKIGDRVVVDQLRPAYEITNIVTNTLTVKEIRNIALAAPAGDTFTIKYNRAVSEITAYGDVGFQGARVGDNVKNYTQLFRYDVQVSDSAQEMAKRGSVYTVDDLYANGIRRGFETLAWELYEAATVGVGQKRTSSLNGFMNGLRQYIDVSDGNVVEASGALTLAYLNNCAKLIYDDMSMLDQLVMAIPTVQNQKMAALDSNAIRYNDPQPTRAIGSNVAEFIPDISGSDGIPVIVDPNMPQDEIWFLDTSRIKLIPLGSQTFRFKDQQTQGTTAAQGYINGEYTMVVRNGKEAHGIVRGLSV
jgi:hypothetical protein